MEGVGLMKSLEVVNIYPSLARAWILHSHQRKIDLIKPRRYIAEVLAGRWNPEFHRDNPIIVRNDICLNGHHRLIAVLMLGKSIPCYVEFR